MSAGQESARELATNGREIAHRLGAYGSREGRGSAAVEWMHDAAAAIERLQARVEELERSNDSLIQQGMTLNARLAAAEAERDALRERAEKAEHEATRWALHAGILKGKSGVWTELPDDEQANSGAASTPESPLGGGHP